MTAMVMRNLMCAVVGATLLVASIARADPPAADPNEAAGIEFVSGVVQKALLA